MPVNSLHPNYSKAKSQWDRCRDAYEGGDAVKGKKTIYLPKLGGQDANGYNAYLLRSLFFGATQRTVEGVAGSIMRKDPTHDIPDKLKHLDEDTTFTGVGLPEFSKQVISELFITGRIGVLIDRMPIGDTRIFWSIYKAENIINWKMDNNILVYIVLEESYELEGEDKYTVEIKTQYRELLIEDGKYLQRIHRESAGVDKFTVQEIVPTQRGKALDYIPFVFGSPSGVEMSISKSPILDLADVNLSHYRSSADLEHGRHFTALPTIYCSGVSPKDLGDAIHIGSGSALVLPPPEAKAGIIEFTGKGLSTLTDALKEKEEQMAKLGARMLAPRLKTAETAETTRINASSEESVTISISKAGSDILTKALTISADWETIKGNSDIILNTDIIDAKMDPKTLTALLAVRQAGEISAESFTYNLKRGELLMPDDTIETERGRLSIEGPDYGDED